jgi:hypothetical protein
LLKGAVAVPVRRSLGGGESKAAPRENQGSQTFVNVGCFEYMSKRTSINDVREISDLNDLNLIVKDKRVAKRASAKKERRNRHYVKVLIKSQVNNNELEAQ